MSGDTKYISSVSNERETQTRVENELYETTHTLS